VLVASRGASRSAPAICSPTSGTPFTAPPALANAPSMAPAVSRVVADMARPESWISRPTAVSSRIPSCTFMPIQANRISSASTTRSRVAVRVRATGDAG
jgi:hypothetical protein